MLTIDRYAEKFKILVDLERKEEMRIHEQEMRNLSGRQREKKGRAILHLRGGRGGRGLGGKFLVKFTRPGEELPETEISVGDLVMISPNDPFKKDNPSGTLAEKTRYSITLAFDDEPPGFVFRFRDLRADLYVNDITFQRMLEAISLFERTGRKRLVKLRGVILGFREPGFSRPISIKFYNKKLNFSQKNAVKKALSSDDFFLIHGPPGTGKTITCIEIIRQVIGRGEKVLAAADSNTAVDNMVEKLIERGVGVVRIGHPARVTPSLREHTLDYIIEENELYQQSRALRENALKLKEKQKYLTPATSRWRRGMSDGKIRSTAKTGKAFRGVPSKKLFEMSKWLDVQEEVDELFDKANTLEGKALDIILDNAEVICATNSTCGSEIMGSRVFDLAVIDESTQSTEPSCLIPIIRADRVVMAGDHKQLPPTILNEEAEKKGLGKTLFERLMEMHGEIEEISEMLQIQYRMHEDIMNFSNRQFYKSKLIADDAVRAHGLNDLGVEGEKKPPVIFLDTSNMPGHGERTRTGSTSRENPCEAELVVSIIRRLLDAGIKPPDIAVIAPYDDQVNLIRSKINIDDLEIKTVDGFQGKEKEVVVVSFTRSNPGGEIGFLEDLRRLNVSLTRAKRKLILIGDTETICSHPVYKRLIDYVKDKGEIFRSLEEFVL
ncbi:MAG: hypothetical protein A7316_01875 [Candidatus Altiarchaeales archaeon WOR_SM1_86-2]|nr:MAG: hypothetical protein A7316_01875 [Candidatus Altiarchaeales archaeon WOR_SM1_86-2]